MRQTMDDSAELTTLTSSEEVARLVLECLDEGKTVEIDGLGRFRRTADGRIVFTAEKRPRVFLAYVTEDYPRILRLYHDLRAAGYDPWLDRKKLLPGQNWVRAIEQAIALSDFFLACFSRASVHKPGQFQAELRFALDCARRLPLDDVFFIPVRLEECSIPATIAREIQYVDLFPDWQEGVNRLLQAMYEWLKLRRQKMATDDGS